MAEQKTACIVCKKEGIKGTPVRKDVILDTIKKVKTRLGIVRGFKLIVCPDDIEVYRKKRAKFEKMAVLHTTVAAILIVLLVFGPILLGAPFNLMSIFFAFVLGVMVAALALLSYVPALEGDAEPKKRTPDQIAKKLAPKETASKKEKTPKKKK